MKTKKITKTVEECEISSGNVFADLGLQNAEELLAKAELAIQINKLIKEKKLTQKTAAKLLEIDQPKVSLLLTGKLSGFSLERLFRFLNKLGQSITINIEETKQSKRKPHFLVVFPEQSKENIGKHR